MVVVLPLVLVLAVVAIVHSTRRHHSPALATRVAGGQGGSAIAQRHAQRSFWALAWASLSVILGVVLLLVLVGGDPNAADAPQRWGNARRVTVAWVVMVLAPVVGSGYGYRALKEGDRRGGVGLALNGLVVLALTALALFGGILDGF